MTPEERHKILLAVLRARGPTMPSVLGRHPVLREVYDPPVTIRDDLEALDEAGEVVTYSSRQSGATSIEAWDVAGVERSGYRARYQRAAEAYEDGRREYSPLSHEWE